MPTPVADFNAQIREESRANQGRVCGASRARRYCAVPPGQSPVAWSPVPIVACISNRVPPIGTGRKFAPFMSPSYREYACTEDAPNALEKIRNGVPFG